MNATEIAHRAERFRALHARPEILVMPNPWDVGTARLFEQLGFEALATTSAGLAYTLGKRDGNASVDADETFAHARAVVAATRVPITADLENGFGADPDTVAATIRRAGEVGLAGASIEDCSLGASAQPLYDLPHATERIAAAVEAARGLGRPFVLTARAENFIRGVPDLDDAMRRLEAYDRAGADVLFAPGLPDDDAIRLVCRSFAKPINHVVGIKPWHTIAELAALGVRRVSFGSSFARHALAAVVNVARDVRERGDCRFVEGLPRVADVNQWIDPG